MNFFDTVAGLDFVESVNEISKNLSYNKKQQFVVSVNIRRNFAENLDRIIEALLCENAEIVQVVTMHCADEDDNDFDLTIIYKAESDLYNVVTHAALSDTIVYEKSCIK